MSASEIARVAFDDVGSGPPIVFLHGLTFSRSTWQPIIDRLADRFRCIAVDLPGHGESSAPPGTLAAVAEAVHSAITPLDLGHPVLVGHSAAGVVVSVYAATYPVAGVVNVDQPLFMRPFGELVQRVEPQLRGPDFAEAFEPFRRSIGVEELPEPLRAQVSATQRIRQDVVLAYWSEPLTMPPEELQFWIDGVVDRITAPYLAIFGQTLPDAARSQLQEHLRTLQIEEWPGQGHLVHLVDPDRFCERLAAFVTACYAR